MTRSALFTARFGVIHRFLRIALGTVGVVAAYRYDLPLGLLGLLLIASGIVGWCSVCDVTGHTARRWWPRHGRCAGPAGGSPA